MLAQKRIAIIGSGTMGRTIVSGLLKSGRVKPKQIRATARTRASAEKVAAELSVRCTTANAEAAMGADLVILCVKPKDVAKAYVDWVLSPAGQKIVTDQGFVPITK